MTVPATTKEHTGAMIALMLDQSDSAALLSSLPDGVAPVDDGDGLHLTLLYLGDTKALGDGVRELAAAVLELFAADHSVLSGTVSGVGRFTNDEGDGTNAVYASFDAGELPAMRQRLVERLANVAVASPSTHGFTPHITLAYVPSGAPTPPIDPPALKLTFRALTLMWAGERRDYPLASGEPTFTVTKGLDGRCHWVLISSNSFQDREQEIVSQKALEDDIARADADGDYGPLSWWHLNGLPDKNSGEITPVTVLGNCTGNAMHGRMLVEWGDFISERVGLAIKEHAPMLAASLDFRYPENQLDADGVFHKIRRTGRAILPRHVAANSLTALPIIVQKESQMVKEKVAALKAVLGGDDELVNSVLALAESKEKAALTAGMRHKEVMAGGEFTTAEGTMVNVMADMGRAADQRQKATITIDDGDKPKGDDKPKDEDKPAEAVAEKPADAPAADAPPPADGEPVPPELAAATAQPAPDTIGNYTEQQLAEYVSKVVDAVFEKRDAEQGAKTAAKEARDAELLTAVKEQGEKLDHILARVEAATAGATVALNGVAELKGETPRSQKGHRASQTGKEIADDDKRITKMFSGPSSDPMAKHYAGFVEPAHPVTGQ